jgi:hypothetical protein
MENGSMEIGGVEYAQFDRQSRLSAACEVLEHLLRTLCSKQRMLWSSLALASCYAAVAK